MVVVCVRFVYSSRRATVPRQGRRTLVRMELASLCAGACTHTIARARVSTHTTPHREREIVLGKTRHTQFVSYTSRRRVVPRVDPHARVRSSMVVAPVRLPPRTRVTTLHTSLNQRIQSTEPSGATSSPSAQGRTRRILEDAIRAGGVVCVIFVVRSPAPRSPRGSLVAPGRERRGRRM